MLCLIRQCQYRFRCIYVNLPVPGGPRAGGEARVEEVGLQEARSHHPAVIFAVHAAGL